MKHKIQFTEVTDIADAQIVRAIRNECKDYMTRSTDFITEEQQEKWFEGLDRKYIKIFLMNGYIGKIKQDVIGFGYCKREGDEVYLTGGLKEIYRGQGHGRTLFSHLMKEAVDFNVPITLEVLNTNTRAENLYKSLGFVAVKKDDRVTKMEYKQ